MRSGRNVLQAKLGKHKMDVLIRTRNTIVDDQTILATSEQGSVTVCPGGIVHVHLPHCSIKLTPADFVKFSELVAKARVNFDSKQRSGAKPRLQLVSTDTERESQSESKDPE
jgi:hypothetical protein